MLNPQINLNDISNEDYERYSRHIILEEISSEGQNRINQSSILVIGAGGLSSPALLYLTASGIGKIGIIDDDTIELSNLQRQIMYNTQQLHQNKVDCALQILHKLNPLIKFTIYKQKLTKNNITNIFYNYDIIMDGTDNFKIRNLISQFCYQLHKIHIYGAIEKFIGHISVFNYQGGPNYFNISHLLQSAQPTTCNQIGILNTLAGLIGTLQATEAIKIITGTGKILNGYFLTINILDLSFKKIRIQKNNQIQKKYNYKNNKSTIHSSKYISLEEIDKFNTNTFIFIDVRQPIEFKIKRIKQAINIPLAELKRHKTIINIKNKYKKSLIIIYCNNNIQSQLGSQILYKYNIDNYILDGGINNFI